MTISVVGSVTPTFIDQLNANFSAMDVAVSAFSASVNATYGEALSLKVQDVEQVEYIRRSAEVYGFENSWMLLGSGTAVTDETTDTYIATIGVQSFNWSGTNSRPVAINIGTVTANITDTITKIDLACMGELDKLDITQSGGAVTVNRAAGWRIRSPIPHAGVTITDSTCLIFTDPSNNISGTVTNHAYIEIPGSAGGAGGPATVIGIKFDAMADPGGPDTIGIEFGDMPTLGSITTKDAENFWINGTGEIIINGGPSDDIDITAGTGSNGGNVTAKGSDVILDTRTEFGRVSLKNNGKTVVSVGNTSGDQYLIIDANSSVLLRPAHAVTADLSIGISGKGSGSVALYTNSGAQQQVEITHTASAVNRIQMTGAATGANPNIRASSENLVLGSGSALATSATAGHVLIPGCAGTPSGAVTGAGAGALPLIYDTTADKLWVRAGGTWRSVALT